MKIVKLVRYAVEFLPVVIAAMAVLSLLSSKQSLQSRVSTGVKRLGSRVPLLILMAILYFGLCIGANVMRSWTEASTVIGFNYKEASQGLNPNSTRFNTYDIISDEVLEEVIQRLATEMSARQLRSTLSVYPLAAGSELSAEQYYVSTEYVLTYTASPKSIRLNPRKTVDMVAEVYEEQFNETYGRKTDVLDVDISLIDKVDYLDKPDLMEEMASKIQEYMQGCQLDNPSFRSSSGENFGDVGTRAGKFKNVTLERLKAYILSNGVSEDRQQYISRLNYDNTIKNSSYRKNLAAYEVRLNAIDAYERDMASIVLVPTRDEEGEFYMGRTKVGVDNFAVEAEAFMESASNLQKTIETNNYEIGQLSRGSEEGSAEVDQLLETAKQELCGVADSARNILEEYDASNARNNLVITSRGRSLKTMLGIKRGIIMTAGFLVAAVILFIVRPGRDKSYRYKAVHYAGRADRQRGRL